MSVVAWAGQTVTRLRAAEVLDGYGNTVLNWSSPDALDIDGVTVQPQAQDEQVDPGRDAVPVRFLLIGDPMDVQALDRVAYAGSVYEVAGEPLRWRDGILDHDELYLIDVRG